MKHLNQKAQKIFDTIIDVHLNGKQHIQIGEKWDGFMPLVVEKVYTQDIGTTYSFAHYYKCNGDMMQDPEMLFIKHINGKVYPAMFQMAAPPVYEESIFYDDGKWKVKPKQQKDHTSFAQTWLNNIKEQQNI